jgi:formylglycine-generating enzyme required for sulfatase activity
MLRCEPEVAVEQLIEQGFLQTADPEEPPAVRLQRLTRLCCSEQGTSIDDEYLAKGVETLPQMVDMPWGVIITILTWIQREIGPEVLGNGICDVLTDLVQELRERLPSALDSGLPFEPELVRVPAGIFLMGTSDGQISQLRALFEWAKDISFDTEQPQHRIHLPAYQIGRYPINNAQYAAFVQATARDAPRSWPGGHVPGDRADHPVTDVTWHDAQAYVAWLRQRTGPQYRLPTEAEWEKAARGPDARIWPWGSQPPDQNRCNFDRQAGDTTPAGHHSPQGDSPYGCADMAGNVWEWCQSLYKPYPYQAGDGREDLQAEGRRVLRGGSFIGSQRSVRCAYRS